MKGRRTKRVTPTYTNGPAVLLAQKHIPEMLSHTFVSEQGIP